MTAQATDPARLLVRLYPARYRAVHGQEIAAVHAEATADLTGLTLLREHASLAAHALRLRTRLSSTDPAGRVAAGAAPFALAGAIGLALLLALCTAPTALTGVNAGTGQTVGPAFLALAAVETLPWLGALVCVLTGRWAPARALVLLGTAEKIVVLFLASSLNVYALEGTTSGILWCWTALGMLVLVAPPDLVDVGSRRSRLVIGVTALLSALPILGLGFSLPDVHTPGSPANLLVDCWPGLLPAAAVLTVLSGARPDRLRALGIGLAALPWAGVLMPQGPMFMLAAAIGETALVGAPLICAALLAAGIRRTRARLLPEPLDPA